MFRKSFIIAILALAIGVPLMAQGTRLAGQRIRPVIRQGMLQRMQGKGLKPGRFKQALNLTPDQISGMKAIVESNKAQRQALGQDARQKAQTLRDLTAQSNPNPTDVGNAVLALKQVRSQAQQMREQTLEKFKALLTPDQVKTLEDLQAKRKGGKQD